jgi:hypothetical protein
MWLVDAIFNFYYWVKDRCEKIRLKNKPQLVLIDGGKKSYGPYHRYNKVGKYE